MTNAAWFVDDETPPPKETPGNDVLVESLGRIGRKRIVADEAEELPQRQRSVGSDRERKPRRFGVLHRRILTRLPGALPTRRSLEPKRRSGMFRVRYRGGTGFVSGSGSQLVPNTCLAIS